MLLTSLLIKSEPYFFAFTSFHAHKDDPRIPPRHLRAPQTLFAQCLLPSHVVVVIIQRSCFTYCKEISKRMLFHFLSSKTDSTLMIHSKGNRRSDLGLEIRKKPVDLISMVINLLVDCKGKYCLTGSDSICAIRSPDKTHIIITIVHYTEIVRSFKKFSFTDIQ